MSKSGITKIKRQCYGCAYRASREGSSLSSCKFNWRASNLVPPGADLKDDGCYQFPMNYDPVYQNMPCPARKETADNWMTTDPVLTYVLMDR